jgi:hypothetical protein
MLESSHHLKNKNSFLYSNKFDSLILFFFHSTSKTKTFKPF